MPTQINTEDLQFIARGNERSVYVHPTDADQCIKVVHTDCEKRPLKWLQKIVKKEIKYLLMMQQRNSSLPFSHYYGEIQVIHNGQQLTAHRFKLIRDADGQISRTLSDKQLLASISTEKLWAGMDTLFKTLTEADYLCSYYPPNILCKQNGDGSIRLYIVDDICRKNRLHPYRVLPFLGRIRARNKYKKFKGKMKQLLSEYN